MKNLPLISVVRLFREEFKEKWDSASKENKIECIKWFRESEKHPLGEDENDVPYF